MKCPICNADMETWEYSEYGWGVMESGEACPNDCYTWEYSYGSTFVNVGDIEWMWSYNEPRPQQEIDTEIERLRGELLRELEQST